MRRAAATILAAAAALAACGRKEDARSDNSLRVQSAAFEDGATIPEKFAADGKDVSPPLSWSAGPKGTACYALVVEDPDAPGGTWVHWIAWNIEGTKLDEGAGAAASGIVQGRNSWKKPGYGGPDPPGGTHRYVFRVFALDAKLDLGPDADRAALDGAMRGREIARGELTGEYSAKR